MRMTRVILLILAPLLIAFQCHSKDNASSVMETQSKEKLIGNIVKNALEQYHFRNLKVDKELSDKAFDLYLKRVDFGKQFLLKGEVDQLNRYRHVMHEQMVNGNHILLDSTMKIMASRLDKLEKFREQTFKKQFDFTVKETLETDPDKRTFLGSEKELKDHWRRVFKHATLTRFLSLKETEKKKAEAQSAMSPEEKKAQGDKLEKVLSDKEIMAKAHEGTSDQYKKFFSRLQEEDRDSYIERFFNAIAGVFDPHTNYMPPRRKEDFDIDISGSLEGIGAVLSEDGDYIKVVTIVPGGAAWRQKDLEVDDVILAVGEADADPVDLVGMRVDDAVRYIRGKKGTEVRLTVRKVDGSRKIIPIIRDVVQIGATYAKSSVIQHSGLPWKIGYIHVPKFYRDFESNSRNCTDDVRTELARLKEQKVDAVILDLRNNGGGALEDARTMSGLFIKGGPIVQIRDGSGRQDILRDNDKNVFYDGPLVVMVNRFSASASEILAGALQDYGRAIIVGGEQTHGKGTVQAVLNLNQGPLMSLFGESMGALKVTIQKFYRVNGASTQYRGVVPDIILPDPAGFIENREQDLDHSIGWDEISPLKFEPWKEFTYDLDLLRSRSAKRVAVDPRMIKIRGYVSYLINRRKETLLSLHKETLLARDKENEAKIADFKLDEENEAILVSNYEASLRANEKIAKEDEEKWNEDMVKRKQDWLSELRKDAMLEETLYILDDFLKTRSGQKLTMVGSK
jgi:carboxyl-terminal processing protease